MSCGQSSRRRNCPPAPRRTWQPNMAGIFLLLSLCVSVPLIRLRWAFAADAPLVQVVMALTYGPWPRDPPASPALTYTRSSFLAGALPLSLTLSQSQLRLISSIGVGILMGTSLIVIIPEGIEAAATPATSPHSHGPRSLAKRVPWGLAMEERREPYLTPLAAIHAWQAAAGDEHAHALSSAVVSRTAQESTAESDNREADASTASPAQDETKHGGEPGRVEIPALEVGFSMVLGFILMFLIDRLPRHVTEAFQRGPQTTHMSLDSLGVDGALPDEADGFLGYLTPTPRRARSLATTIGLVIHAAADGISLGASSAASNMRLGLIIFVAIMIHKAPAAFGLTAVLLRQGLSKRVARGHLVVFSMAAPAGALATWLLIKLLGGDNVNDEGQWRTGMLLLFSGGTFLYVSMHAMNEDTGPYGHDHGAGDNGYTEGISAGQRKPKGPQMRDTLATVTGMFLPLLTQFGHGH